MEAVLADCKGHAKALAPADAITAGQVVVNALPWPAVKDVLSSLNLRGKILLDATNPLLPNLAGLEVGTTTSGAELVAQWAPGAQVVKIFNSTGFANMADPCYHGQPVPMFYCGDDAESKTIAASLAKEIGFAPVDAGPLTNARLLEPLALFWIWLAHPGGLSRDFAFQIVKR